MIIIGEKLNSSIKAVREAVAARDSAYISSLARSQSDAGADYLDCNTAMLPDEAESLLWLVNTCRGAAETKICLDSPDPAVIEYVLSRTGGQMINSISLEKSRFDAISRLALEHDCSLIALCMDSDVMPETVEERESNSIELTKKLNEAGITGKRIFIDPLITPVGAVETSGRDALEVISRLHSKLDVNLVCGLSNISYGLPARAWLNRAFLVSAIACGLNSAVLNPLDKTLMRLIKAQEALLNIDEFCESYIDSFRDGFFED